MRVLAGDIGGTHTRLAVYDNHELIYERQYPSRAVKSFTEYLNEFIKGFAGYLKDFENGHKEATIQKACLAVAGVIGHGRVMATNLPWAIDSEEISISLGLKVEDVRLINDFEAAALGVTLLRPDQLIKIGGLEPESYGTKALIGAGTGLGEAIIAPVGEGRVKVIATEGGHADFAPVNDIEIELLRHLIKRFGHVSTERVLSGPGLVNIYRFLIGKNKDRPATADIDPAEITRGAINGDAVCIEALGIFASIYGSEAGNLALRCLATGGVYLGGGIATEIIPFLTDGRFRKAFESKGRMSQVLKNIPVFFVREPRLGLIGARITAQGSHAPS